MAANKHGTRKEAVLTDQGIAIKINQKNWTCPVTNGWHLCDVRGNIRMCAEGRSDISKIAPKRWVPLPEFSKGHVNGR